jgi:hypothetical protein
MDIAPAVWLGTGLAVATLAHEATHWLLARCHGVRLIGFRFTPFGVALIFPAVEEAGYLLAQVAGPVLATWIVLFGWLHGPRWPDASDTVAAGVVLSPVSLVLLVTLVALTMSVGDLRPLSAHLAARLRRPRLAAPAMATSPS